MRVRLKNLQERDQISRVIDYAGPVVHVTTSYCRRLLRLLNLFELRNRH
jgi:hypothetical protein